MRRINDGQDDNGQQLVKGCVYSVYDWEERASMGTLCRYDGENFFAWDYETNDYSQEYHIGDFACLKFAQPEDDADEWIERINEGL